MDYSIQETLATVSKAFTPELVLFRYKELPFFQNNFAWTYKPHAKTAGGTSKGKLATPIESVKVTCICTFVASMAAVEFYQNPQNCLTRWSEDDLWHMCNRIGSDMHRLYVRDTMLRNRSIMDALGMEAMHCTPSEYIWHLDGLVESHTEFAALRELFAQRSLRTLTDKCQNCGAGDHAIDMKGNSLCVVCGGNIVLKPIEMSECFTAISQEAHARAGRTCAFVVIFGARSFFIGVDGADFLAMDSHTRTFRGYPTKDCSICLKGRFGPCHNLDGSLGEVWRRGELGYKDSVKGSVWTWGDKGSGAAIPPKFVPDDAPQAPPTPQVIEDDVPPGPPSPPPTPLAPSASLGAPDCGEAYGEAFDFLNSPVRCTH